MNHVHSKTGRRFITSLLIAALLLMVSCSSENADFFELLAMQRAADVPGLTDNPEPVLPESELPWSDSPETLFTPADKIDNQQELEIELQRMREEFLPFMADQAPAIPERNSINLREFEFRYAAESEWEDISGALKGSGEWEAISIPHYAGPTGDSVSFYRKEIVLDDNLLGEDRLFICFNGVDYYTDLYVNGQWVGNHEGLFDAFEFDIKPLVKPGKNEILVRVANEGCMIGTTPIYGGSNFDNGAKLAASGGPGWDDPEKGWICTPVGYGLWQDVRLEARNEIFINDLSVRADPDLRHAEVTVEIAAAPGQFDRDLTLEYSLFGQNFEENLVENREISYEWDPGFVNLFIHPQKRGSDAAAYKVKQFRFTIEIDDARLWTPASPWLYQLQIAMKEANGTEIDNGKRHFGMRSFEQRTDSKPKGRFYLNGDEIRLRGANMMGNIMQCIIRKDWDQLIDDILLAKIANMNFWRMTQQPCQREAYDFFDRLGLMAQSDLPTFAYIPEGKGRELVRQGGALFRMVRSHPSNAVVSYINEPMYGQIRPIPRISIAETAHLFEEIDTLIDVVNPDQVVKWVDGDYANMSPGYSDHHCYNLWYWNHTIPFNRQYKGAWTKSREGWMHGCGEYGAEGIDSLKLMKKYYPEDWLGYNEDGSWSADRIPCQSNRENFKRWIGEPESLEEFIQVSREHQRVAIRLQTEALRRDPKMNSTAIHLLIDAWPAGWMKTIVDYDRQAKPSYFEFIDAQEPVAVNLRPDAFYGFSGETLKVGTWICNDTQLASKEYSLKYQLIMDGRVLESGSTNADLTACEPEFQGWLTLKIPEVSKRSMMKLQVGLFSPEGEWVHDRTINLEAVPASHKGREIDRPGGLWQFLIES